MALKHAQQVILSKHSPKHSHALRMYTCLYPRLLGTISTHSYPTAIKKILRERPHTFTYFFIVHFQGYLQIPFAAV